MKTTLCSATAKAAAPKVNMAVVGLTAVEAAGVEVAVLAATDAEASRPSPLLAQAAARCQALSALCSFKGFMCLLEVAKLSLPYYRLS